MSQSGATDSYRASQGSDKEPAASDETPTHISNQHRPVIDMIFYGIGSIESSRNSQFQLALGLCLREILQ
ncbi:hypothetical protein BGZ65_000578, partial [Modicella reniformis]